MSKGVVRPRCEAAIDLLNLLHSRGVLEGLRVFGRILRAEGESKARSVRGSTERGGGGTLFAHLERFFACPASASGAASTGAASSPQRLRRFLSEAGAAVCVVEEMVGEFNAYK